MHSDQNPLLTEGIFDLGLPAEVAETINRSLQDVPEKGKTMIGNILKGTEMREFPVRRLQLLNDTKNYLTQIRDFFIVLAKTGNPEGKWSKVPTELKDQFIQLQENLEKILTGYIHRISFTESSSVTLYKTKIMDYQRAGKMLRKSFKRGIFAEVYGKPVDPSIIDSMEGQVYDTYSRAVEIYLEDVTRWLKENKNEYKKIPQILENSSQYPIDALAKYAADFIQGQEVEEQKLHTFADTSYWYDLQTNQCPIEAERMGHCGGDIRANTLFSLRYKSKGKIKSSSYVTVGFAKDKGTIYQIKGKFNKAPEEKYYPHIAWLIKELGDPLVMEAGEHSDDIAGFIKMSRWLEENTDAEIKNPHNKREVMEDILININRVYNNQFNYASIDFDMMEDGEGDPYYGMSGKIGVLIPSKEFTEEAIKSLVHDISSDFTGALDKISSEFVLVSEGKTIASAADAPELKGEDIIFYFHVANLVSQGANSGIWSTSSDANDFEYFGDDVLNMDRNTTIEGNNLQEGLRAVLGNLGYLKRAAFLTMWGGVKSGRLGENTDWVLEANSTYDDDDESKLVWAGFPSVSFDLKKLERDGVEQEYYRNPKVVEKILNSNTYKGLLIEEIRKSAEEDEEYTPEMTKFETHFKNYRDAPQFIIEANWIVKAKDNNADIKSKALSKWLQAEFGKSEFEEILHTAYYETLNELFSMSWISNQKDFDFPGGKRLRIDEKNICKSIHKNWVKNFEGF